jgi:hypothetical protein
MDFNMWNIDNSTYTKWLDPYMTCTGLISAGTYVRLYNEIEDDYDVDDLDEIVTAGHTWGLEELRHWRGDYQYNEACCSTNIVSPQWNIGGSWFLFHGDCGNSIPQWYPETYVVPIGGTVYSEVTLKYDRHCINAPPWESGFSAGAAPRVYVEFWNYQTQAFDYEEEDGDIVCLGRLVVVAGNYTTSPLFPEGTKKEGLFCHVDSEYAVPESLDHPYLEDRITGGHNYKCRLALSLYRVDDGLDYRLAYTDAREFRTQ